MIQFIHVYLNITILYQGDAMQISNLVSQYNNSVANGEPMTGAKGVEKLEMCIRDRSICLAVSPREHQDQLSHVP